MIFDGKTYSVLVVSAAEKFDDIIRNLLSESSYAPITFVNCISAAKRAMVDRNYDLVIINSPLPDDAGIRFSIDACNNKNTVSLLIVRADMLEEIHAKVVDQGVFTLAKPLNSTTLSLAIKWLTVSRERLRRLEAKTTSVEAKMEEIRLVNRAKWILIEHKGMTEDQAHHYIEHAAMDKCTTKRSIAEQLISEFET